MSMLEHCTITPSEESITITMAIYAKAMTKLIKYAQAKLCTRTIPITIERDNTPSIPNKSSSST